MERLSALDATFVAIEDVVNHMHIGSVGVFEGPPPRYEQLHDLIASKLDRVPRYRQRVREAPLALGRPLWIDDPHFRLGYHLRHSALPAGAGDDGLETLVGRLMSQQLDRHKPLWEMWLVEGLGEGRWALVSKVHHCMVDGIAGTDLLAAIMDLTPDAAVETPTPWVPEREPSRVEVARNLASGTVQGATRLARDGVHALAHPGRAVGGLRNVVSGLRGLPNPLVPKHTSLLGPIGPHRRWVRTAVPLERIAAIRSEFGGTVNDVVLTAVTRAFRDLLAERGEWLDDRTVPTLIPVSTRSDDARGVFDNRVSALFAHLPVGIDEPVDTLRSVQAQMLELKSSHEIEASSAVIDLADRVPSVLGALATRAVVHSQEMIETVATNVPGPQFPLYVCGRAMVEAYPYVPIAGHIRIGVAILSYDGAVFFGITGDHDTTADLHVMTRGIDAAISELTTQALTPRG